ncbi:MAG: hypothetical protein AB8H80_13805 [Planctomycetota bacterium]
MSPSLPALPRARVARFVKASIPVAVAVALAAIVVFVRQVEMGAENDGYAAQAEMLLRGELEVAPYHPMGYSLLLAAALAVLGNGLVAGGLVSALCAGTLVWSVGELAKSCSQRPDAWLWGQLFAACNAHVWVLGTMASSDMTGATMLTLATLLAMRLPCDSRKPNRSWLLLLGLGALCGFAVACRFSALAPAGVLWMWAALRTRGGGARRGGAVALLTVGALAGYAPEGVPRWAATGQVLPSDNWHNFYLKVVCEYDLEQLQVAKQSGALPTSGEFFAEHVGEVFRQGVRDVLPSSVDVVPALIVGAKHVPPFAQLWPLLLAGIGLLLIVTRRRTQGGWLLMLLALVHCGTVCLFWPRTRLFFPVLPLLQVGLVTLLCAFPVTARREVLRRVVGVAWVILCLGVGVGEFRRARAAEPIAEANLARSVPQRLQRPVGILSPWAGLRRYVEAKHWGFLAPLGADPSATWLIVSDRMQTLGADLFLCGKASSPRLYKQLAAAVPPAGLSILVDDGQALLVERQLRTSDWIASCTASASRGRMGEPIEWRLELSDVAIPSQIYAVGCALRGPAGAEQMVVLQKRGSRQFAGTFVPPTAGTWCCAPWVLRTEERIERAVPIELEIEPN